MEEVDKGCPMIGMGVSGWMFLLVPAYPGSPGQKAIKRLCVYVCGYPIVMSWDFPEQAFQIPLVRLACRLSRQLLKSYVYQLSQETVMLSHGKQSKRSSRIQAVWRCSSATYCTSRNPQLPSFSNQHHRFLNYSQNFSESFSTLFHFWHEVVGSFNVMDTNNEITKMFPTNQCSISHYLCKNVLQQSAITKPCCCVNIHKNSWYHWIWCCLQEMTPPSILVLEVHLQQIFDVHLCHIIYNVSSGNCSGRITASLTYA